MYGRTFGIGSYMIGYTSHIDLFRHVETGIGANFSTYSLPSANKPYYDDHVGGNIGVEEFGNGQMKPREVPIPISDHDQTPVLISSVAVKAVSMRYVGQSTGKSMN